MQDIRLTDIARPMFLFASTFGERIARGENPSTDQLMSELKQIMLRMDAEARSNPKIYPHYEKLRTGLIGLADDVVYSNHNWPGRNSWMSLERALTNTQIAGDQVYEIIEGISGAEAELAEGYFFVLSLGFRGRCVSDEYQWGAILGKLYAMIPKPPGMSDFHLTPNAYRVLARKSNKLDPLFSLWRSVIIFFVCLVAVIVFYQTVWSTVVNDARTTSQLVTAKIQHDKLRNAYDAVKQGENKEATQ